MATQALKPIFCQSEQILWCMGNFWKQEFEDIHDILFLYTVTLGAWGYGQNITISTSKPITNLN